MNKLRLYDLIKNIEETISLLNKALFKLEEIEDEERRKFYKIDIGIKT